MKDSKDYYLDFLFPSASFCILSCLQFITLLRRSEILSDSVLNYPICLTLQAISKKKKKPNSKKPNNIVIAFLKQKYRHF